MRALVIAGAFFCLTATQAMAGVFGIEMGTPLSRLDVVKVRKTAPLGIYEINVPKPNSEFEAYMVVLTPKTGVCKIMGIGKDHPGDISGAEIRGVYSHLSDALTEKYGKHKTFDFIKAGSIWKDEGDFAMSLYQKERTLETFWDAEEASTLPSDLSSIDLQVTASSRSSTYLTLAYEFSNWDQCSQAREESDTSGL
jgi:hypothetical protein